MRYLFKLIIVIIISNNFLFAQNENNNWFFGQNCGLSFNPTVTTSTGNLNTFEGCASISDKNGVLLFYTDGITVYDRNGGLMQGGNGLLGNSSSTSSAIIVPKPCSETEYFIFAVDFINGSNGVSYSLVDMDDNNDCFVSTNETGKVVLATKNISLPGPTGERICAVKNANGLDYWVIATEMNTNNFYVYEVTELGVIPIPSIPQPIGSTSLSAGYYMKVSPDGTKIGLTDIASRSVFLYNFDNIFGQIGPQVLVGTTPIGPYGLEFSPNSKKLYYSDFANGNGTGIGRIYEVDILPSSLGTPCEIAQIPNNGFRYACGALQLTPENPQRILIAKDGQSSLAAIENPDDGCIPPTSPCLVGTGNPANFKLNAITLTSTCYLGLPTFISGSIEACKPLDMAGYQNTVPDLFSNTVKSEIVTDRFSGLDKEYDDIDNDGDVDILFTKSNILHYYKNTVGYCNVPSYPNPSISLNIPNCYSFRLFDWDGNGANDLIIHGDPTGTNTNGIFLYLNNGNGAFTTSPIKLLDGIADFFYEHDQLIEVGDINGDSFPDILISGQGAIYGTHYFENNMTGGTGFNYSFNTLLIPEDSGSYPCPELYDADCQNGLDILLSDPLTGPNSPLNPTTFWGGGRVKFYENLGGITSGITPNFSTTGLVNQFGFDDLNNDDLRCDWVITRIVDFYNDGCPIAISYNPCNQEIFFYYQQGCVCSNQNFAANELANNCLIFDRTSISLASASSTILNNINTQDFTFEAWISGNETDQDAHPTIFSNRTGSTGTLFSLHKAWPAATGLFKLLTVQFGQVNYFVVDNGTYNKSLLDGDCHHVAITRAGDTLTFFIDGQIIGTRTITGTVNLDLSSTANLTIGYDFVSPNSFNGSISDIRIWSTARTPAEINNTMLAQLSGNEPNLVANWLMNEGTGQILNDNSINGNNAILGNNANIESIDPIWDVNCCSATCPEVIVNNENPILPDTYHAAQIVESVGTVVANTTVTFKAGQNICLENGFEVEAGATFSASIEACDCDEPAPNNLTLTKELNDYVTLTWDELPGVYYYIEYKINNSIDPIEISATSPHTIQLTNDVYHQFTIFSNCDASLTDGNVGRTVSYTRSADCDGCSPPSNLNTTLQGDSLLILNWDPSENGNFYVIELLDENGSPLVDANGEPIIIEVDGTNTTVDLTGLPDAFEVVLSVDCGLNLFVKRMASKCHSIRGLIIVVGDVTKHKKYCNDEKLLEGYYTICCEHYSGATPAHFIESHCD